MASPGPPPPTTPDRVGIGPPAKAAGRKLGCQDQRAQLSGSRPQGLPLGQSQFGISGERRRESQPEHPQAGGGKEDRTALTLLGYGSKNNEKRNKLDVTACFFMAFESRAGGSVRMEGKKGKMVCNIP